MEIRSRKRIKSKIKSKIMTKMAGPTRKNEEEQRDL